MPLAWTAACGAFDTAPSTDGADASDQDGSTTPDAQGPADGSFVDAATPPDASSSDGAVACTASLAVVVQAVADTFLLNTNNANPANRYGTGTNANVGQNMTSVALFRFDVTTVPGAAWASPQTAATLTLRRWSDGNTYLPVGAGTLQVFPMRSDWNEGNGTNYNGAEWNSRMQTANGNGVPWGAVGASSATDRGTSPIAVQTLMSLPAVPAASPPAAIIVPLTNLATVASWISVNSLTLQVAPSNPAPASSTLLYLNAHESGSAASLTIHYCP